MSKEKFNNAVIMNEENMFLCQENDESLFWKPCTQDAILFPDNIMAEEYLKKWNKKHPCCILSGVRIAQAPKEEGIPVCSKEGQNTTVDPHNTCDDDGIEDYLDWTRDDIVNEIYERELEDKCDVEEDSTQTLRTLLMGNDNERKENINDVDEPDQDYSTWGREEIIDKLYQRDLQCECDIDEDSTQDLRNVLIDYDETYNKNNQETYEDYSDWNREEIVNEILDRSLDDLCDIEEDSTQNLRNVLKKDDDNENCQSCDDMIKEALRGYEDKIKKIADMTEMLQTFRQQGDKKNAAVTQMNLGKIKKEIKEKIKDFNPDEVAKIITFILDAK